MVQYFKGDSKELQMYNSGAGAFDVTDLSLSDMYDDAYQSDNWVLLMYDEGRMPFSDRVPRDVFTDFIREAMMRFHQTGSFETYIFILKALFGEETEVFFDVDELSPGVLDIDITSLSENEFDFIGSDFSSSVYEEFQMVDYLDNVLTFRSTPGVETESQLDLLLSEIIPAGISAHVSLNFISRYDFVALQDDDVLYDVIDNDGNQIVFIEAGG